MLAAAQSYVPHLHHALHDWLSMGAIVLAFALPSVVAAVRHRLWRRRIMSAFR